MTVNQCNFERITRSLRRVRAEPTSRQVRQDVALASLGFSTLGELEDQIADAADAKTSALRAEEFRQKRAHMARAAACMEAVFSLPDLEPMLGPLDKVARDAVITSLKRCQSLVLAPLPVDPSTISVAGLTPDIIKMILAGQSSAGAWDPWVPHQALFEHRHAEPSPPFHANIVETFHSADPGWVYLCFRNSGKSTLSEEGFILRALLRLFGNALVLGFNQQRAVERLEAIKHELETNERINAIFGDPRGQVWQGQKVTLSNGVCLQAVGSGQSLRGIKHYDFRPDCLLLDDVEGDIGASTPLEREDTKKWFFGTVLPSLASRSIIRMAATPLDAECLPITLGKSPTWRTMVVPVKVIRSDPNDFFNPWCAEQGITATEDEDIAASIEQLPHVIEEQHPAKSFDLVHEAVADSPPPAADEVSGTEKPEIKEAARRANAERQRRYRERKKAMAEAKSDVPAPSPPVEPEAQRELTEVERAMAWRPPEHRR